MIQANELRLGNWIEDFGDGYGQVTDIDKDDIVTTANPVFQPIYTFNPIPLTPEILIACGFEKLTNPDRNRWAKMGCPDIYFGKGHYMENVTPEITSLHQLQNLYFALTGTELEYKPLPY